MGHFVDTKIQELESKLNQLYHQMESVSDNNHFEHHRIQMKITEIVRELGDLKNYRHICIHTAEI